jgi:hypothetical protein
VAPLLSVEEIGKEFELRGARLRRNDRSNLQLCLLY